MEQSRRANVMRAFLAIQLPEEIRVELVQLQRVLAGAGVDVKWVDAEQLHVTLKFLGEVSDADGEAIRVLLRRVAEAARPITLRLQALGAFPSIAAPRVIWVGITEGAEPLARLVEAIEQGGAAIPLRREERAFSAHVTLGRVRSPRGLQALVHQLQTITWPSLPPWQARAVTLYQSVLTPAGPRYTVLAEGPLGAPL